MSLFDQFYVSRDGIKVRIAKPADATIFRKSWFILQLGKYKIRVDEQERRSEQ
jgi:hypothetical protein